MRTATASPPAWRWRQGVPSDPCFRPAPEKWSPARAKSSLRPRMHRAPGATAGAANARVRHASGRRALRGLLDPALQVFLDELGGEHDFGIVFGSVLDLLQVVQPAVLVDPVDRRDEPHRLLPAR